MRSAKTLYSGAAPNTAVRSDILNRAVPIHPPLLAGALLLSIVLPTGASPFAGLRLLIAFILSALLLTIAARLLLGDRHRAGVAATVLVLLVFRGHDWRIAILLLVALGVIVLERLRASRRPSRVPWAIAGRVMNAGAVVLLGAVLLRGMGDGSLGSFVGAIRSEGPVPLRDRAASATPAEGTPDVFLVLLDGHARADKLESVFGTDGSEFLAALDARGFEVAPASRSNYLLTAQSLTSLLNMGHIVDIVDREVALGSPTGYTNEIRRLAANGAVFAEFRSLGYEVVAVASGFEEVALRGADRFIDTGQINELEVRTIGNTAVAPLIQLVAPDWFADQHRSRVGSVLEEATRLAHESHDRPRLVLIHVPSPHAPIVFDADGSAVPMHDLANFYDDTFTHRTGPREEELARYAAQLRHVDDLTLPVIDEILAGAEVPPVVIIASDHGSAANLAWNDLEGSDLDERTAILFAALTPDLTDVFPPDITLVNVFGRLLEAYFGRPHTPLPDTAYRWADYFLQVVPIDLPVAEPSP